MSAVQDAFDILVQASWHLAQRSLKVTSDRHVWVDDADREAYLILHRSLRQLQAEGARMRW